MVQRPFMRKNPLSLVPRPKYPCQSNPASVRKPQYATALSWGRPDPPGRLRPAGGEGNWGSSLGSQENSYLLTPATAGFKLPELRGRAALVRPGGGSRRGEGRTMRPAQLWILLF